MGTDIGLGSAVKLERRDARLHHEPDMAQDLLGELSCPCLVGCYIFCRLDFQHSPSCSFISL